MDFEQDREPDRSRSNIAEGLREQAASYRRLAAVARTSAGTKSLGELADTFDERARGLDPSSERL
jgi:hypothetical protein